jgi:hypothetical protein|tara:strand:+ start:60 stop:305 length:246 start_codon:yes stop_codon:yes gene_type:complete
MKFQRYKKDGSADIIFDDNEKQIINKFGKLHFTPEALKHFGNHLVHIVAEWHLDFNDKIKGITTKPDQVVKTEEPKDNPKV